MGKWVKNSVLIMLRELLKHHVRWVILEFHNFLETMIKIKTTT